MSRLRNLTGRLILLVLSLIALSLAGCSTTDPENASARPWNSPRGWENGGMPGGMSEGR